MANMKPLPEPNERPTVSVPEAGEFLGIGRATAYEAAKAGDLPTIRLGKRLVVPTAALRRMLGLDTRAGEAA